MKLIKTRIIILSFTCSLWPQTSNEKHVLFTQILRDYVQEGLVNYINLKDDIRLDKYIKQLENTNLEEIKNDEDRLAFWINAYNAYTLKFIVEEYPVESINDLHWGGLYLGSLLGTTVWDDKKIVINGIKLSLNNIEHDIARQKYNEERVHFAMVCASLGCPQLRSEAYEGDKLNYQLNEQAKLFFNDKSKNKFDLKTKTAHLNKILDWYDNDFGKDKNEILIYVSQYLDENLAEHIKDNFNEWQIDYLSYDWDLNEMK